MMAKQTDHKTRTKPSAGIEQSADKARFLADYDPSKFEHPSLTVDVVLLTVSNAELRVAVVKREAQPAAGKHALPGTFVGFSESLESAAQRVIKDKIGRDDVFIEQLYTFGEPQRDPRTRVVTVAYYALVNPERLHAVAVNGPTLARIDVPWAGETGGRINVISDDGITLKLAFDHAEVIGMAVKRVRGKLNYAPLGYQLLPREFTLRQLQTVHETILGHAVNKDSFRRRMLATGELEATGTLEDEVGHRPAELYRFTRRSAV